jgi:hypothetical protein
MMTHPHLIGGGGQDFVDTIIAVKMFLCALMVFLLGQCQEIFCFKIYHESSSPKSLKITLGSFTKICGDIHKSRYTTGIKDKGGKFSAGVNYTGGILATGINSTGGKFYLWYYRCC